MRRSAGAGFVIEYEPRKPMKVTPEIIEAYKKRERASRNKIVRKRLFKKDPHCYYCGIETKEYSDIAHRDLRQGEKYPDDMATLEHLYDRYTYKRYIEVGAKVLACYKCNVKRANQRNRSFPKSFHNQRRIILEERKEKKSLVPRPLLLEYTE